MSGLVDCVVIGTGMSGLTAARHLQEAGRTVELLDKGHRLGGRIASRRIGTLELDHGSWGFEAERGAFARQVEQWIERGWVFAITPGQSGKAGERFYRPARSNIAFMSHLAEGLVVHQSEEVDRITPVQGAWEVQVETGRLWRARSVILTIPAPQAKSLLSASRVPISADAASALETISYQSRLTLLVSYGLHGPPELPRLIGPLPGEVGWILDQGNGLAALHGNAQFSREHLDDFPFRVAEILLKDAGEALGKPIDSWIYHRWRFAVVDRCSRGPFAEAVADPPLLLCGDGYGPAQHGVERAWTSGRVAAGALLERLP